MHFMKFPAILVQVAEKPFSCQKMPLQRKTIKINDYQVLICWDVGSTRLGTALPGGEELQFINCCLSGGEKYRGYLLRKVVFRFT